jgi:hypothetical protein
MGLGMKDFGVDWTLLDGIKKFPLDRIVFRNNIGCCSPSRHNKFCVKGQNPSYKDRPQNKGTEGHFHNAIRAIILVFASQFIFRYGYRRNLRGCAIGSPYGARIR